MTKFRFPTGAVWSFRTENFHIELLVYRIWGAQYDGDDPDGAVQAALDSGEFVAFDSRLTVEYRGETIGDDWLHNSIYKADNVPEFWTDHRSPDLFNRNCSIMRACCGEDARICHYFPDMVRSAIAVARERLVKIRQEAEETLASLPKVRESAL